MKILINKIRSLSAPSLALITVLLALITIFTLQTSRIYASSHLKEDLKVGTTAVIGTNLRVGTGLLYVSESSGNQRLNVGGLSTFHGVVTAPSGSIKNSNHSRALMTVQAVDDALSEYRASQGL